MGESALTPQQLEALLSFASKKLGVSQEQLARSIQSGNVADLGLSAENSRKLEGLLGDRKATENRIRSPQAQAVLEQLLRDKGREG